MNVKFKHGSNGYIALSNLLEAQQAFKVGMWKSTGFWSQQAVECLCKQYLKEKYGSASAEVMRSHNLARIANSDPMLASLDSISGFATVQSVYFNTRYEGDEFWELDDHSAAKTLKCAEKACQEITDAIESFRRESEKRNNDTLKSMMLN